MNKSLFKIVTVLCTAFCGLTMVACSTGGESTTNENNNQNTEEEETSITFADFIAKHSDKAVKFYNDNFSGITAGKDVLSQTVAIGANSKDELENVRVSCIYKVDDTKRKLDIIDATLNTPIDLDDIVSDKVVNVQYTQTTTNVFEFDAKENKTNTELKDALFSTANVNADLFTEVEPRYQNARTFNLLTSEDGIYTVGQLSVIVDDDRSQEHLLENIQKPSKVEDYFVVKDYSTAEDGDATIISTSYNLANETFKNDEEEKPPVDPEKPDPPVEEEKIESIQDLLKDEYSQQVYQALNENALNKAGRKIFGQTFKADKIVESSWDIGNEDIINEIKLVTTYENNPDSYFYGIGTITLASPINVKELSKNEIAQSITYSLSDATYTKDYTFNYTNSIQGTRDELVKAIFAACGHDLTKGSTRLFYDVGPSTDGYGGIKVAHGFKVAEVTDTGVQEYTIRVAEAANDDGYCKNLEKESQFAIVSQKSTTLSGNFVTKGDNV